MAIGGGWVVSWAWVVSIEHPWMPSSTCRQPAGHFSRTVRVTDRLRFFDAVVTPLAFINNP